MSVAVVDLFAGAGGLTLGFESAGTKVVHAIEIDPWAAQSYLYNFPRVALTVKDIRDISDDEIRTIFREPIDVIIGGPPCQGFSHANTGNRDPKDPRNSLFVDFIKFTKVLRPMICVIENVRGLLSAENEKGRPVVEIIQSTFDEAGYDCEYRLLDAADYGIPQHRERLFIVAVRRNTQLRFNWPNKTHEAVEKPKTLPMFGEAKREPFVTLWDSISDLPQITSEHQSHAAHTYRLEPQNAYQKLMRIGAEGMIFNHEPMRHYSRIVERFSRIKYGQSEADVAENLRPRKRGRPNELSGKSYDQNSRRQRPDMPSNTIVASSHTNYIHPFLNRNFTVREMLRIQSFPDRYMAKGNRAVLSRKLSERKGLVNEMYLDQRMQVGNAVPPLLAKVIGESVINALSSRHSVAGQCS